METPHSPTPDYSDIVEMTALPLTGSDLSQSEETLKIARSPSRDRQGTVDHVASQRIPRWSRNVWKVLKTHAAFVGPGVVASIGYMDPGNWATDLQAGSGYGYSHLFIILLVGFFSLLFQVMATHLGLVTGNDLAVQCRLAFYDRPRHKLLFRYGLLYPLYAITELGIIFTDLAELLGSAIAINLLIPQIPLWACVLLTSLDVLLVLAVFSDYPARFVTRKMRFFEFSVGALVFVVLGVFIALLVESGPVWRDVFFGYVPGPGIVDNGGLYIAVGILGATMATMRRLRPEQYGEKSEVESAISSGSSTPSTLIGSDSDKPILLQRRQSHWQQLHRFITLDNSEQRPRERPSLGCVNAHMRHSVIDIVGSLLGFAIVVNSAILILAASVFYYGSGSVGIGAGGVADLFDAFDLVKTYIGQSAAYLFAIGLLAAGQSSSITVTLSGQIVSEGFINWRTKPWIRRIITRLIGIVPSFIVAIAVGRQGVDTLLVASQVALSIVLPFVLAPLILFTTSQKLMSLPINPTSTPPTEAEDRKNLALKSLDLESAPVAVLESPSVGPGRHWTEMLREYGNPFQRRKSVPEGCISFANAIWTIQLSWFIWAIINVANIYAIYAIAVGA